MFDLAPGEELELIAETATSFAETQLAPHLREAEAARAPDPAVRAAFAAIGLDRLELPERLGGAGLGPLARVVVHEALGAADPGAALALDPLGPALYALAEVGGEDALERFGLPLLDEGGEGRAVLVVAEDAALERRDGRLHGRVPWVPADRVDLLAILEPDGATLVRDGLALERLPGAGLRAAGASELRLDGAPEAARWHDAAGAARALGRARLHAASLLLGVLHGAAEFARRYALERQAFGRPIAHHQALAFLIVDMRCAVDGARLLLREAAWRAETGRPFAAEAAAAFAEAAEAAAFVGPQAVQILGGHGFMQDYPVEKAMREARALASLCGGLDAAREAAGRALCEGGPPLALGDGEPR